MGAQLSVVVASVNGFPYLGDCVASLVEHCPGAEIVVADCTDEATRERVRTQWPQVLMLGFDEPTSIPELRAAGIAAASAPYVAVIEDHCVVRNGWAKGHLAAHTAGYSVVGGPICNGSVRLRDWAAFLFEYSPFLEPFPRGATTNLPGMNVSYDRRALEAIDDLLRAGRWEGWLHERLRSRGFVLYGDPATRIDHVKDFGIVDFALQRFHYARAYAAMRADEMGVKRYVYAAGAPAIVPLLYTRVARNVFGRRRHRRELVLATPLLALYLAATAAGEAAGFALGGGRSLLRVK